MEPRYNIEVVPTNGNAFAIMGETIRCLKRAGASAEEIEEYKTEVTSGDYDHLLQVTMKWVNLQPSE